MESTTVFSEREQVLMDLMGSFGVGFWEVSVANGNAMKVDPETAKDVGLENFEGRVEFNKFMEMVKEEDRATVSEALKKIARHPGGCASVEYRLWNRKDGKYHWVRAIGKCGKDDEERVLVRGTTLILEGGRAWRLFTRQIDLANRVLVKREQQIRDLTQAAYTDSLTGLYNRRHFMELSTAHLERAKRYNSSCFMMIMDLDHFKNVNDAHGHLIGDEVLKNIAKLLKKALRSYDLLARYGGEEFVVFIADSNKDAVLSLSERIRTSIEKNPYVDEAGNKICCTVSIGVARNSPDYDVTALLDVADSKLYTAKELGRNRVVFE
jgi:diguanylate cyclase (GGDEF)-like protein